MNKKYLSILAAAFVFFGFAVVIGCSTAASTRAEDSGAVAAATPKTAAVKTAAVEPAASGDEVFDGRKITKTKKEWQTLLSKEQFYILRQEGTEQPYTGKLTDNHEDGYYYCAGCHLKLFSSAAKFESNTGWPSFYEPFNKKNVTEIVDKSLGMERTEVECARCGGHLGHVFDDGPEPTGLRYCMNSASLTFEKK